MTIDKKFLESLEVADGEDADCLVCRLHTTPLQLPDNLVGHCARCFRMIQYRPHAPKTPEKVCDDCAVKGMAKDGDVRIQITEASLADLRAILAKKAMH